MRIIKTVKFAQNDIFKNNISVDVYAEGLDLDYSTVETIVSYSIDIEWRNFGIKDISVIPVGNINLALRTEEGKDFEVIVDCSKIKTEKINGSGVWIDSLNLFLNGNLVDYNKSYFDIVCA